MVRHFITWVLVCGRFGLWPFWFGRSGFSWPFWFVAVRLWPFWFVAVLVWSFWFVAVLTRDQNDSIPRVKCLCLYFSARFRVIMLIAAERVVRSATPQN